MVLLRYRAMRRNADLPKRTLAYQGPRAHVGKSRFRPRIPRHTITGNGSDAVISDLIETPSGAYLLAWRHGYYTSTDSGLTWKWVSPLIGGDGTDGGNVHLASNGKDAVYSTGGPYIFYSDSIGVFRSTDNGRTWTEPDTTFRKSFITDLRALPGDTYAV